MGIEGAQAQRNYEPSGIQDILNVSHVLARDNLAELLSVTKYWVPESLIMSSRVKPKVSAWIPEAIDRG